MSGRRLGFALCAGLVLVASFLLLPADGPQGAGDAELAFPLTIRKLWYRNAKRAGLTGAKHSGDLTIDRGSLEFFAKKQSLSIPLEDLWMISFGTMRGDVDTEWVVLTIRDGDERSMVGMRDGSRWGYGRRTREIYETLVAAAEKLSAAQFARPDGFEAYTELDHVFSIPIPAGWSSYHHDLVSHEGTLRWGTVVFSEQSLIDEAERTSADSTARNPERKRALRDLQQGRATAWVIERFEASGGMTCDELKEKALRSVGRHVTESPFFGVPFTIPPEPQFESTQPIDGCQAVQLTLRAPAEEGRTVVLDLRVTAREETVLLIGLRTTEAEYDRQRAIFDEAVEWLRLASTR